MSIITRFGSFISLVFNYRSSLFYNTSARHERHECDRAKYFDFDSDMTQNIFSHPYISYKANFILRTTFENDSFPCQNAFEKCTTETELCNSKSYIKKL